MCIFVLQIVRTHIHVHTYKDEPLRSVIMDLYEAQLIGLIRRLEWLGPGDMDLR